MKTLGKATKFLRRLGLSVIATLGGFFLPLGPDLVGWPLTIGIEAVVVVAFWALWRKRSQRAL